VTHKDGDEDEAIKTGREWKGRGEEEGMGPTLSWALWAEAKGLRAKGVNATTG
jgi:hypothetical protein